MSTYKNTSGNYTINLNNGTGNLVVVGNTVTNGLIVGSYTAANASLVSGVVGAIVAITNSPTVGGRLAFWDTTNSRWSYVSDNSAV
jgi:hypothetical protein